MPFKSEKQRKYLHANEPEIAQDWEEKYESDFNLDEEIEDFFKTAKEKHHIDPQLQQKIDLAKNMSTWELIMNPPWNFEDDFSPDLLDIDIDIENV